MWNTRNGTYSGTTPDVPITPCDCTYTVEHVNTTPYVVSSWNTRLLVNNVAEKMVIILPDSDADSIGKTIRIWNMHNPANFNIHVYAFDTLTTINGVSADGADVAKVAIKNNRATYEVFTAMSSAVKEVACDGDNAFNAERYALDFTYTGTNTSSGYDFFELDGIPTGFLTRNTNWWFAVKLEKAMAFSSSGQSLFCSDGYGIAIRSSGDYFMTTSTSGYLITISPNTVAQAGSWIIYSYDTSSIGYRSCWLNGSKVVDYSSSGVEPTTSTPTIIGFGMEPGASNYFYNQTGSYSNLTIGLGFLTDADAALFTEDTFTTNTLPLTGGFVTNEIKFDASGAYAEYGFISGDPSIGASNITFSEL